jgi:hypothetical protein
MFVRPIALAAVLALAGLAAPLATTPTAQAAVGVKITLSCYGNPEKTKITNIGTVNFKITKIVTTYQPTTAEPFNVSKTLAPGQYVTYLTGRAASGPYKLYTNYIYNNEVRDGAKITTSVGVFTKYC